MSPSTLRAESLPNCCGFTLRGVSFVSARFAPVRALSYWEVVICALAAKPRARTMIKMPCGLLHLRSVIRPRIRNEYSQSAWNDWISPYARNRKVVYYIGVGSATHSILAWFLGIIVKWSFLRSRRN